MNFYLIAPKSIKRARKIQKCSRRRVKIVRVAAEEPWWFQRVLSTSHRKNLRHLIPRIATSALKNQNQLKYSQRLLHKSLHQVMPLRHQIKHKQFHQLPQIWPNLQDSHLAPLKNLPKISVRPLKTDIHNYSIFYITPLHSRGSLRTSP